ncbi:MAG TPA: hypothetical protein VI215_08810 [Bacteroidota bacterium]|jgi:hypothetical protein
MNKKLWVGFIAVYVGMTITNLLIHVVLLAPVYHSEEMMKLMRPEADAKTWIFFVTSAIISFVFTLIFSKGYTGKGMGEGIRYGLWMGLLMATPMAYDSYASYPIPYSLALQWFLYGMIQYVILGAVVAMVYGKSGSAQGAASA